MVRIEILYGIRLIPSGNFFFSPEQGLQMRAIWGERTYFTINRLKLRKPKQTITV